MKKSTYKHLFFMNMMEYQKLLENLNISKSTHIVKYLKMIKHTSFICGFGIYLLYYFFDYEYRINSFFKEIFGDAFGTFIAVIFVVLLVCIFLLLHEIFFSFLPKFVFLKQRANSHYQSKKRLNHSRNGSMIDPDKH